MFLRMSSTLYIIRNFILVSITKLRFTFLHTTTDKN